MLRRTARRRRHRPARRRRRRWQSGGSTDQLLGGRRGRRVQGRRAHSPGTCSEGRIGRRVLGDRRGRCWSGCGLERAGARLLRTDRAIRRGDDLSLYADAWFGARADRDHGRRLVAAEQHWAFDRPATLNVQDFGPGGAGPSPDHGRGQAPTIEPISDAIQRERAMTTVEMTTPASTRGRRGRHGGTPHSSRDRQGAGRHRWRRCGLPPRRRRAPDVGERLRQRLRRQGFALAEHQLPGGSHADDRRPYGPGALRRPAG